MDWRLDARLSRTGCKIQVSGGPSLRVDSLGRWSSARLDGDLFRRVLTGGVVHMQSRIATAVPDPARVHCRVVELADELRRQIERGAELGAGFHGGASERARVAEILRRAAGWSVDDYLREAEQFGDAYPEPIEILPPDRYGDIVVLPAVGCPNASCSFCAFYKQRRFRPLSGEEFRAHVAAVKRVLGPLAAEREGFFLGSASALSLSQRIVLDRIGTLVELFGERRRGVAAFWDPDHSPARTSEQWAELRAAGLSAVYLGLETGDASLRAAIGKSADLDGLVARTDRVRSAGLLTGVMVLAGIGETDRVADHCRATAEVVGRMSLSDRDLVFVSPLRDRPGRALVDEEAERLRRAVAAATRARVAPYGADRFYYCA